MQAAGSELFPKWFNQVRYAAAVGAVAAGGYVAVVVTFGFSPYATDVGYQPVQPIPYSHAVHAGEMGMDCRYCHSTVWESAHASVPPTQTCMGCHTNIRPESEKLVALKNSFNTGRPIEWVKVHDLPDYAYFDHSAHVNRGVGCISCHGRVDRMEVVWQVQPLSMSWCLDCHRAPERHLRPLDRITDMEWTSETDPYDPKPQLVRGLELKEQMKIHPSTDCSTCHR